jgi:hypothetical protein
MAVRDCIGVPFRWLLVSSVNAKTRGPHPLRWQMAIAAVAPEDMGNISTFTLTNVQKHHKNQMFSI